MLRKKHSLGRSESSLLSAPNRNSARGLSASRSNEARTRLRRQALVRMEPLDQLPDEDKGISPALLRDWREIPSEAVERDEVRVLIQRAVEQLPEIYRQVFLLRDVEELTISETAEALNISIPSVKVRLHRARMMLQKQLAPQLRTVNRTSKRRWFPWS